MPTTEQQKGEEQWVELDQTAVDGGPGWGRERTGEEEEEGEGDGRTWEKRELQAVAAVVEFAARPRPR